MLVSVSSQGSKKIYTFGFNDKVLSLEKIVPVANSMSISGPGYKNGHRKAVHIIRGSNIILIDCDKEGQAEAVESKLKPYDYVKVPSASNLTFPYKWHYFVPTQEPLSVYPGAYKYQVQQFFNQVGITDEMVDTTGSYDIARQFAPALFDGADKISFVNDTGLQAPVLDVPEELNNKASESVILNIDGVESIKLPINSVWYQGKAITYDAAIKAVNRAYEMAGEEIIVSGFGCPHDNHQHKNDCRRGYGYAYKTDRGEIIVKCSGNECKEQPYFNIPMLPADSTMEAKSIVIYPVSPEQYRHTMEQHWINNLGQIKADGMDDNWHLFASTMNHIICNNQKKKKSTAYIVPLATGESKTQGSIVYLSLIPEAYKAMMVVRLNDDATQISEQINSLGGDAVPYNSTVDITIKEASKHQIVIPK